MPCGWTDTLTRNVHRADLRWIAQRFFGPRVGRETIFLGNKFWNAPPEDLSANSVNVVPSDYFGRRIFLWFPVRFKQVLLNCVTCGRSLMSKGRYTTLRVVYDVEDVYYMGEDKAFHILLF
jgi:hypothetical protein